MNNDYVSIIKSKMGEFVVRWYKKEDHFTIEDDTGEYVVIFNGIINDLITELSKLKNLIEESPIQTFPRKHP